MSTEVDITTTNDTWVNVDNPTTNYDSQDMRVRYNTAVKDIALISFDISSIPSGQKIDSAVFYGYVVTAKAGYDVCTITKNDASFVDSTVIWNTKPGTSGASLGNFDMSGTGWKTLTITATVQGWYDSSINNYGFQINAPTADQATAAYLDDESGSNDPYLKINYSPVSKSGVGIGSPFMI